MAEQPVFSFWQRTDRDAVAVVDPDGTETTVGALIDRSHRVARSLRALGLRHGDVVAFVLPNSGSV